MKNYKKIEQINKLLEAKEKRFIYQQELIKKYKNTLISFMLNIPGEVKSSSKTREFQKYYVNEIKAILKQNNIEILYEDFRYKDTGDEYFAIVNGDAVVVKNLMINLEESKKECRLLDIDIFDKSINQISRQKLGFDSRKCLVCGEESKFCMRNGTHTIEEIIEQANNFLEVNYEKKN